ncbi:hypothetical protein [Cyanothece sp. BG0011]|uniref:hypothetical protein n=1 Tax=Cyanothece sp. BG0011 TaxID=2082950 RepID=UPI000D1D7414|nr:hypothetical protein [Cyanothece sp. BG0011]
MVKPQENKTFEADGIRPIESGEVEIVETFEEDGVRPIVKGFDYVTRNQTTEKNDSDNHESKLSLTSNTDSEVNEVLNIDNNGLAYSDNVEADKALPIDGERPINNSDTNVVDTFEADGTRPIMANKYEVVDTLDIDGERPIASQQ